MEIQELRKEYISYVEEQRQFNIPQDYNVQRDPDYADWLERKITSDAYCMPDNINSKEEHDEYLKAIGYEKHVKMLQYFYDTYVDTYAIDFDPKELIKRFVDSQSDATRLLVEDVEELVEDWGNWIDDKNIGKSPFQTLNSF